MPKFENLSQRCKFYEKNFGNGTYLMDRIPILCRIDGKTFHTFCKGLQKPFDSRLSGIMIDTLYYLVETSGACWGYTQSDEISLCYLSDKEDSQIFFDGRRQKLESVLASMTTYKFNQLKVDRLPEKKEVPALFDCRAWNVPNKAEAIAYAIWRERDCTKNSLTMAAGCYYSHNALHGKNGTEKHQLLFEKGVNWNDYPNFFKRGTYVKRYKKESRFTTDEVAKLPEKHAAHQNPNLTFTRTVVECLLDMPPLEKVENKIDLLFGKERV